MNYKFIKVQMKAAPDGKQPTGFWLFEPQSERQIFEHWEKYARATSRAVAVRTRAVGWSRRPLNIEH